MPFWTLARLAAAVDGADPATGVPPIGGRAPAVRGWDDRPIRAVTTDTRAIQPGDAFVALKGEQFDAHDFLADAVAKGAAALIVRDAARATGLGVPVLAVDDTLHALGRLGTYRRRAWGKPVVGIGGSNGKTSTKELVRAALGARFRVHATTGNLNNQVGVPLTLLAIPDDADIAVVEMGTSVVGEMAILRDIVRADLIVITSIGEEHLEGLGDLAGVLAEEAALADGAPVVVVPSAEAALRARIAGHARRVVVVSLPGDDSAGDDPDAAWRLVADHASLEPDGRGRLAVGGTEVVLPLVGAHNLRNALLAVAVAQEAGVA
ncbi:MAG: UDP-N-acetylmuramoyl-tripeptide--D-alanyl-D-alanine ligase, partial [Gemmatimonadetes bacterium]|nr:UDP-N-acetylmuramoyl-tripeptide--D-alanyl-D-alanine ligase [Gemmatimonadota bacterium]